MWGATVSGIVLLLLRLAVGGSLFLAAAVKLTRPHSEFVRSVLGFELLPRALAPLFAAVIPPVELGVGAALIVGFETPAAAVAAAALIAAYTGAIVFALLRAVPADCGCFGGVTRVRSSLVYRNVVLLGLAAPLYLFGGGVFAADAFVPRPFAATNAELAPVLMSFAITTIVLAFGVVALRLSVRRGEGR